MGQYISFVVFAAVIAVAPGPDTFLTLRNTVIGGRTRGLWTTLGIAIGGVTQGLLAACGLGAVIANAQPVFLAIRWAGVAYLVYLGVMALRAAFRPQQNAWQDADGGAPVVSPARSLRQGLLCNITNPKVLAFNLAVLPQFTTSDSGILTLLAYALTLTLVGTIVLLVVVLAATKARDALRSPRVNRGIEAGTGVVMLGFAGALAAEG